MFAERGGSSSFARHAFNELVSFIAGWAILIDYIIVVSFAADLGCPLPGADLGGIHTRLGGDRGRRCGDRLRRGDQHRGLHALRPPAPAHRVGAGRRRAPDRGDRRGPGRRLPPGSAHRSRGAVHGAVDPAHPGGAGRGDAGVRGDRGRVGPGAGLQLAATGPADGGGRERGDAAGDLRGNGGDRIDGGAGGVGAGRAAHGAGRPLHRGAGAGGGDELPAGLVIDAAADRGGGDRPDRADVGGQHVDARPVAARLRPGEEPAGPQLAREAGPAVDAAHRDPVSGGDRGRAGDSDGRAAAGGDLRVRGDARDRHRTPVDPSAPVDGAGPGAAVPDAVRSRGSPGGGCRCRRCSGRC